MGQQYKYNDSGIRTLKIINGAETKYYLDGNKVIYETRQKTNELQKIYYTYDENGYIIGLEYENNKYYFIKNVQNDIIGILNSNLEQIVKYEYDSWGNVISITDTNGNNITDENNIALINEYRYRSYRYDSDTGLYYLQSRYYNPEWGRFINADGFISTGQGLLSHNMYAYCNNNPVNMKDDTGKISIFATIVFCVVAIITIYCCTVPATTTDVSGGEIIQDIVDSLQSISLGTETTTTKTDITTQSKVTAKNKERDNNDIKYYEAKVTYPGANVYMNKPLSLKEAAHRVNHGKDVWAINSENAVNLCITVGGGFEGPTKDSNPLNAWHYHPKTYKKRGHVFVYMENLKFIY